MKKSIEKPKNKQPKRWLWFVGLYVGSLLVVALFSFASRALLS